MSGEVLWNRIISELSQSGEELKTLNKGLWFRVTSDKNRLYVDKARDHIPSCEKTRKRVISKKDFLFVFSYYDRWLSGEKGLRHEVSRRSRNVAYIFALIDKFRI